MYLWRPLLFMGGEMKDITYSIFSILLLLSCNSKQESMDPIFLKNNENNNCEVPTKVIENERKCYTGDYERCITAADDYIEGHAGIGDYRKGYLLYEFACNGGYSQGCRALALLYDGEMGILQKDVLKREYYFKKACDFGDKNACEWLRKNSKRDKTKRGEIGRAHV